MEADSKMFIVLGTMHDIQNTISDPPYLEFIPEAIRTYKIDFIAEECFPEADTHAKRIANLAGIGWAGIDLSAAERDAMRLGGSECVLVPNIRFLEFTELNFLTHEIREWVWLVRAAKQTKSCCLLICGLVHTVSISSKLASVGFSVRPMYYMPREVLRQIESAQSEVEDAGSTEDLT